MRIAIWLLMALGLLSACGPKPGNTPEIEQAAPDTLSQTPRRNETTVSNPFFDLCGTYIDPKTLEVIIIRQSSQATSSGVDILYSNGQLPFQLLKILGHRNQAETNSFYQFRVTFYNDSTKIYTLDFQNGLQPYPFVCTNPDGSTHFFDYLTVDTLADFRPSKMFDWYLRGTFADTQTGELLMFRCANPSVDVYYSDGKNPFQKAEIISRAMNEIQIRLPTTGQIHRIAIEYSLMHAVINTGPTGRQRFFHLFVDENPQTANFSQMHEIALGTGSGRGSLPPRRPCF